MIKTKRPKPEPERVGLRSWISDYFFSLSGDFCDQRCIFWINRSVIHLEGVCIIEMFIVPRIGCFAEIEFNLKIFFKSDSLISRPRIYNDRRVFHPNINIITLEIVVQELHNNWNPTHELLAYLQLVKNIIIEPDMTFVPDNIHNRRAAIIYHFNRDLFPQLILQNQPSLLDEQISKEMKEVGLEKMDQQSKMECQNEVIVTQNDFWNLKKFFSRRKLPRIKQSIEQQDDKMYQSKTIRNLCSQIQEISITNNQMISQQ